MAFYPHERQELLLAIDRADEALSESATSAKGVRNKKAADQVKPNAG